MSYPINIHTTTLDLIMSQEDILLQINYLAIIIYELYKNEFLFSYNKVLKSTHRNWDTIILDYEGTAPESYLIEQMIDKYIKTHTHTHKRSIKILKSFITRKVVSSHISKLHYIKSIKKCKL